MESKSIIQSALGILRNELVESEELVISIVVLAFIDTVNKGQLSGKFSALIADSYNEGFYYNMSNDTYYYYGEAIFNNPGSFNNKYCFPIEGLELDLLPEALKIALKRVGQTGQRETMHINALNG